MYFPNLENGYFCCDYSRYLLLLLGKCFRHLFSCFFLPTTAQKVSSALFFPTTLLLRQQKLLSHRKIPKIYLKHVAIRHSAISLLAFSFRLIAGPVTWGFSSPSAHISPHLAGLPPVCPPPFVCPLSLRAKSGQNKLPTHTDIRVLFSTNFSLSTLLSP